MPSSVYAGAVQEDFLTLRRAIEGGTPRSGASDPFATIDAMSKEDAKRCHLALLNFFMKVGAI